MTRTDRFTTSNRILWKPVPELIIGRVYRTSVSWIYLFEVIQRVDAVLTHLRDESDTGDEDPVILLCDQAAGGR